MKQNVAEARAAIKTPTASVQIAQQIQNLTAREQTPELRPIVSPTVRIYPSAYPTWKIRTVSAAMTIVKASAAQAYRFSHRRACAWVSSLGLRRSKARTPMMRSALVTTAAPTTAQSAGSPVRAAMIDAPTIRQAEMHGICVSAP